MTLLTYGPFENKSSFSQEELNVHFENKNKFLSVTRLERVIHNLFNQWMNVKWRKHFKKIDTLCEIVILQIYKKIYLETLEKI